jgi:hypothetical protein
MQLTIPLDDVKIEVGSRKKEIQPPLFSGDYFNINQNEFSMEVEKVASFYASGGDYISVVPYPGADENSISLYLNGSVYGAILHQRRILPIHGSSFQYNGKGIMICGESGAGKSSVTASFCLNGATFLSDDITPLILENNKPYIRAISDRLKLWGDSLRQLKKNDEGLQRIYPETDKYYYHLVQGKNNLSRLDYVLILEPHNEPEVKYRELTGPEKFTSLRNEIYRFEYLQGMPENEPAYFNQIVDICREVRIILVRRPPQIAIDDLRLELTTILD